ncbi:PH domain-containing protein [Streptomyces sp. NPDC051561]|uniref:PH domain-containing protein n=1 Tax=Streptomyces sp. NPDC051561 TaxID=3365658 RepID=UPI00379991CD
MEGVEYRPAQRRTWWVWCAVAVVLAAHSGVALTTGWTRGTNFGAFLAAFGLLGFPAAPWLAAMALGRTTLDATGVHAHRAWGRSTAAWHDIAAITVDRSGGRNHRYDYWIRIKRRDGGSFRLPAPMTSDAGQDPSFDRKLAEIEGQWRNETGR